MTKGIILTQTDECWRFCLGLAMGHFCMVCRLFWCFIKSTNSL